MSADHESIYLGASLIDNQVMVESPLKPEYFSRDTHRELFIAMATITASGKSADIVSVLGAVKNQEWFKPLGSSWVSGLVDAVPSAVIAKSAAIEIRKDYKINAFKSWLWRATQMADLDPDNAIELAEGELIRLLRDEDQKSFETFGEAARRWLEMMVDDKAETIRVKTGDGDLDKNWILDCGGLHILAGRPGMGKTSVAAWLMQRLASQGCPVLFFSLEMTAAQLVQKQVSEWTRISSWEISQNFTAHMGAVTSAIEQNLEIKILLSDAPSQTVERIAMVSQFAKRHRGLGCIVIDYLQLVRTAVKLGSREQEVAHVSQSLKALAKNLNVPVIALSQLNRVVETRRDRRPMLSDLRESGSIEQDADTVAMLFRPEYYLAQENKPIDEKERGFIELNIAKQRRIGPQLICGKWRPDVNSFMWGGVENQRSFENYNEPRGDR